MHWVWFGNHNIMDDIQVSSRKLVCISIYMIQVTYSAICNWFGHSKCPAYLLDCFCPICVWMNLLFFGSLSCISNCNKGFLCFSVTLSKNLALGTEHTALWNVLLLKLTIVVDDWNIDLRWSKKRRSVTLCSKFYLYRPEVCPEIRKIIDVMV